MKLVKKLTGFSISESSEDKKQVDLNPVDKLEKFITGELNILLHRQFEIQSDRPLNFKELWEREFYFLMAKKVPLKWVQ